MQQESETPLNHKGTGAQYAIWLKLCTGPFNRLLYRQPKTSDCPSSVR